MTAKIPHALMRQAPRRRVDAAALAARAQALTRAGRLDEAAQAWAALHRAAPARPEPLVALGRIAAARGDLAGALARFDAALAAAPEAPEALRGKADALAGLGRTDDALALHDRLIRADPKHPRPRADKALLLQRMGDFEAAERELRRALRHAPGDGALYRMIAVARRIAPGEKLLAEMERAHRDAKLPAVGRMQLDFALAKAMDDTGRPERAAAHLEAANAAMRAAHPYDIAARRAEVEALIAAFRGADFAPLPQESPDGPAPIFVTGLPRSGTTLVEQILAAHPGVAAGGERRFVLEEAYRLLGDPAAGLTPLRDLADGPVAGFGRAYLDRLAAAVPGAATVTDKSIQTHLVLGLVAKAMPGARLIVVRRDPRDLGLSIWRNMFAPGTHLYAYDQADIAAYVASFERMIDFWRETIPGRFAEVAYEDLVADPEARSRALVAAAGLDWEDACLRFHDSDRQVATLSIQQVRQPMHTGATGGWRRHAEALAPMLAAFEREGVALP